VLDGGRTVLGRPVGMALGGSWFGGSPALGGIAPFEIPPFGKLVAIGGSAEPGMFGMGMFVAIGDT
jgi:hypothetical protein